MKDFYWEEKQARIKEKKVKCMCVAPIHILYYPLIDYASRSTQPLDSPNET